MKKRIIAIVVISFLFSNNCSNEKPEDSEITNLKAFAKVYGYVKYFHPSDESASIDWDSFAIYGASKVAKSKSKKELEKILNELFKPIAPSIRFYSNSDDLLEYNHDYISPNNIDDYKLTFWQHEGLGLNMNEKYRYVYKSVRVNSLNQVEEPSRFGRISSSLPVQNFRGKEFKYEALVKLIPDSKGTGHLRVQIINEDGTTGFFENMRKTPITDFRWKKYEITGIIDSNAVSLNFGGQLNGKGTLLLDNISLKIKQDNTWIAKREISEDFETQKTNEQLNWQVYGSGYEFKINNENQNSGKNSLALFFSGKLKKILGEKIFNEEPKIKNFVEQKICDSLYFKMPVALFADSSGTLPKSNLAKIDSLKNFLDKLEFSYSDEYSRIGNIINIYNVFKHFYPYMDVAKVNWESELGKAINESKSDTTNYDFLLTLRRMTAKLKDGHVQVTGKTGMFYYRLPIYWEWLNNRLIITNVYDKALPLKIGDEVTHINGQSSKKFFQEIYSTISAGTKERLNLLAVESSIEGKEGSSLSIKTNKNKRVKLIRSDKYYNSISRNGFWMPEYKNISEGIFYINLTKAPMNTINQLMPELKASKGIIFDLRGYPNSNHEILSHLLKDKDTTSGWMKIPRIIYPDYQNLAGFKKYGWNLEPKSPYLGNKKIVFLTNEKAISYSESILGYVKNYGLGTIIGKSTAGTNGNINSFKLPGGYNIIWTGMKVTQHDGSQLHGIGIEPDLKISESVETIISNEDIYLEKAIELIDADK